MGGIENQKEYDIKLQQLMRRVEIAKQYAIPKKEAEALIREQNEIETARAEKKISEAEYEKKFRDMGEQLFVVDFDTLGEFAGCMRAAGVPEERVQINLRHENAHASRAEEYGLDCWYRLIFTKERIANGTQISVLPMTVHVMPADISEARYKEINRRIASAPQELGGFDIEHLDRHKDSI